MKTTLPKKIESIAHAKKFLSELDKNGESYHPEDNAEECLDNITDDEAKQLNRLMNEIYALPGNEHYQSMAFDPCAFLLHVDKEYKIRSAFDVCNAATPKTEIMFDLQIIASNENVDAMKKVLKGLVVRYNNNAGKLKADLGNDDLFTIIEDIVKYE